MIVIAATRRKSAEMVSWTSANSAVAPPTYACGAAVDTTAKCPGSVASRARRSRIVPNDAVSYGLVEVVT